VQAAAE